MGIQSWTWSVNAFPAHLLTRWRCERFHLTMCVHHKSISGSLLDLVIAGYLSSQISACAPPAPQSTYHYDVITAAATAGPRSRDPMAAHTSPVQYANAPHPDCMHAAPPFV